MSQLISRHGTPSAGTTTAAATATALPVAPRGSVPGVAPSRLRPPSAVVLYLTLLSLTTGLLASAKSWLRAEKPTEDSGESTEKAFMIILAITLGVAVTAAAVAYLKTKTDLFKG